MWYGRIKDLDTVSSASISSFKGLKGHDSILYRPQGHPTTLSVLLARLSTKLSPLAYALPAGAAGQI